MASFTPPHRRTADGSQSGSQSGFTVLELLVALVIGGMIIGTASLVLNFTMRQDDTSKKSLSSSNSAFRTGTRFADDVSSVSAVSGLTDIVTAGTTGCGNTTAVLRLVGASPTGSTLLVRSYHRVTSASGTQLVRRECSGTTLAGAIGSPAGSSVVVTNLSPDPGSTQVDCDGGPVSPTCRVITMRVTTTSGASFKVRGSIDASLSPTPTTTPLPVIAPPTGTCTIPASETAWGATGGAAGDQNTNHNGDGSLYTYNDTNNRRSFLRFDLTQDCANYPASDSWKKLPGGRKITGVTLYLAYLGKSGDSCSGLGISYDGQILQPLNDASTWAEATLTGTNMPSGLRSDSGYSYNFNVADQGSLTAHTNTAITNAVNGWYAAGGWVNNGWRLSRSSVGDTCGKSNVFASRFNTNAALRPKLVITWGPLP